MTRLQELRAKALQIENERPVRPDLWNCTEEEARAYLAAREAWGTKLHTAFEEIQEVVS